MCFSAAASFSASAALTGIGIATMRRTRKPEERLLACVPLLFAVQQALEGFVWLSLGHPDLASFLGKIYTAIAWALWPMLLPIAVSLIEPGSTRRAFQSLLAITGIGLGITILAKLPLFPIHPCVLGHSLSYDEPERSIIFWALYLTVICGCCLSSSHRYVRLFGFGLLFAYPVVYSGPRLIGASVWCFFAATLSTILYFHFAYGEQRGIWFKRRR